MMSLAAKQVPVWDEGRLADPHAQPDKAHRIRAMFDAIAPTYERVNRLFSLGIDGRWRKRVVELAACRPSDFVLDVCTGTGDLARAFLKGKPPPQRVFGLDFSAQMLARAAGRSHPRLGFVQGDGLRLPLASNSCDVVTCAFGVRNFQSLSEGMSEFRRVLRPGGRALILEFTRPPNPVVRAAYEFYSGKVMPTLATWVSRDRTGAYRYLPRSVVSFSDPATLQAMLLRAGFDRVETHPLTGGVVTIYVARVRADGTTG